MLNCQNYELINEIEKIFIKNQDPLRPKIKGFSNVLFGVNFVPLNLDFKKDKAKLKKYGFKSYYELGNHFYRRIGHDEDLPMRFASSDEGYIYLFLSAFDDVQNRHYVFCPWRYIDQNGEKMVAIFYFDVQNDEGAKAYFADYEIYSQAHGYRYLSPQKDTYESRLAWEAVEILITQLAVCLKENLAIKFEISQPNHQKNITPNRVKLAKFLRFCGVDERAIPSKMPNDEKILELILDEASCVHLDWKFDVDEIKDAFCRLLAIKKSELATDFKGLENSYGSELLPRARSVAEDFGYVLCNYETGYDSYALLVFNDADMDEIAVLASELNLPLRAFFS